MEDNEMKLKVITTVKFVESYDTDSTHMKAECKDMNIEQLKSYLWGLRTNVADAISTELCCDEAEVLAIDVEKVEK